ncbi:MAG: hypothetical protein HFE78_01880 [Clostridiales bacterium]|nr:hypothetical protein [Clostridiales bacterium]
MYQNKPFTVEFAYSKTFLTNGDLPADSAKDDKNTNMIEGWYAIEGDKIRCQYTKSKDEQSVTYNLTFSYDKEQDSLMLIEAQLPPADENNQPWPITTSQGVYEKVKS